MPTTKTYTPLTNIPRPQIKVCSEVLPNHLQCFKAGDFLVTEEVPSPDEEGRGQKTEVKQYQLCRAHATIAYNRDQFAIQNGAADLTSTLVV